MFSKRTYKVGDRIMWLSKGDPRAGGPIRDMLGVTMGHFSRDRLAIEPMILTEGLIYGIRPRREGQNYSTIQVLYTVRENGEGLERKEDGYGNIDVAIGSNAVSNRFQRIDAAFRAGVYTTDEQYQFLKKFALPIVVADSGVVQLLHDIRRAANLPLEDLTGLMSDRTALLAEAARLQVAHRNTFFDAYWKTDMQEAQGQAADRLYRDYVRPENGEANIERLEPVFEHEEEDEP